MDVPFKSLPFKSLPGNDLPPNPQTEATVQLPNPPLVTDSFPGRSAWIQDDWKLLRTERDQSVTFELYHLASDPFEQTDVAEQHPEQVQRLLQPLHSWLESVVQSFNGDDYPPVDCEQKRVTTAIELVSGLFLL